jgi:hypothetical protein
MVGSNRPSSDRLFVGRFSPLSSGQPFGRPVEEGSPFDCLVGFHLLMGDDKG